MNDFVALKDVFAELENRFYSELMSVLGSRAALNIGLESIVWMALMIGRYLIGSHVYLQMSHYFLMKLANEISEEST